MNSSDRINNTDRSSAIAHSTTLTTRGRPLTPAALPGPVAGALSGASGPELALEAAAACAVARRSIIPSAPVTALELPPAPPGPVRRSWSSGRCASYEVGDCACRPGSWIEPRPESPTGITR